MKKVKKPSDCTQDKIFYAINYFILTIIIILVAYPVIYVFSASINDPTDVLTGKMWLFPTKLSFEGYKAVFKHHDIWVGYGNSFIYMVCGTALNIVMTLLAAYPLSRKELYGKGVISFYFIFTMFFSGGMIPGYLLIKNLHLLNTRWALIIPGAMSVWNVIMVRTYIKSNIPEELAEASKLDGCGDIRYLISIVVPLSKPVIAVIALFTAVGQWNSYFGAMLYLRDKSKYPLQIVLRNILILNQNVESLQQMGSMDPLMREKMEAMRQLMKYSLIVIASVPLLIMYPFVQKYFTKGIMVGAIKG